jgi:hypothetical protein
LALALQRGAAWLPTEAVLGVKMKETVGIERPLATPERYPLQDRPVRSCSNFLGFNFHCSVEESDGELSKLSLRVSIAESVRMAAALAGIVS